MVGVQMNVTIINKFQGRLKKKNQSLEHKIKDIISVSSIRAAR